MKSHIEDSELVSLASDILEKIMPTFQKDKSNSPFDLLKSLIILASTHFESLEKLAEVKVTMNLMSKGSGH